MFQNCALSVLDSATKELIEKGSTDANDANALGSRATDGKKHLPLSFRTTQVFELPPKTLALDLFFRVATYLLNTYI